MTPPGSALAGAPGAPAAPLEGEGDGTAPGGGMALVADGAAVELGAVVVPGRGAVVAPAAVVAPEPGSVVAELGAAGALKPGGVAVVGSGVA